MPPDLTQPLDQLPDPLPVPTGATTVDSPQVVITPPGSKSITNRALLLAGLARGESVLRRPLLEADDARRMIEALRALGADTRSEGDDLWVSGVAGRWPVPKEGVSLFLQNAGTATRFLAAAAALSEGPIQIDGNARMRERPIGELGAILPALGVQTEYLARHGFPPVRLMPPAHLTPKHVELTLPTTRSSQFISALLMVAPWLPGGLTLRLEGEITSPPYIAMTLWLLDRLGARTRASADMRILRVGPPEGADPPGLDAFELDIEPDASGATYFWAAGALLPGDGVSVLGISPRSPQGDSQFTNLLRAAGAIINVNAGRKLTTVRTPARLKTVDADLTDMPDAAMTLAAVCVFAPGRSVLRGLRTLRDKETDRVAALQTELRKIGVRVENDVPGDEHALSITPPAGGIDCSAACPAIEFDTYDDHRMAMSLALIGLRRPNCLIRDPGCVRKTYPTFWADFASLVDR